MAHTNKRFRIFSVLAKFLPPKFVKHYIFPLIVRRKQKPYNQKKWFESYHTASLKQEFSDRMTIFPTYSLQSARYHYNVVENSIIEYFAFRTFPRKPQVLDIGSGAGHWIDFYLQVFQAENVVGIEISQPCVDALQQKYSEANNVCIIEADISSADFKLTQKFDCINAVGVMFHIVDDDLWKQAVRNLSNHLKEDGFIIVGGQFGYITQNVQFHFTDDFSTWEEVREKDRQAEATKASEVLVNKRIRSLRFWRHCAWQAGLQIKSVQRTRQWQAIMTPENNVLILALEAKKQP